MNTQSFIFINDRINILITSYFLRYFLSRLVTRLNKVTLSERRSNFIKSPKGFHVSQLMKSLTQPAGPAVNKRSNECPLFLPAQFRAAG